MTASKPHERLFSWLKSQLTSKSASEILVRQSGDFETADKAIARLDAMSEQDRLDIVGSKPQILSNLALVRPDWAMSFIETQPLAKQGELLATPRLIGNLMSDSHMDRAIGCADGQPRDVQDRIWLSDGALRGLATTLFKRKGRPSMAIEVIGAMGSQEDRQNAIIDNVSVLAVPKIVPQFAALVRDQSPEARKAIAKSPMAVGLVAKCGELPLATELMDSLTIAERGPVLLQDKTIPHLVQAGGFDRTLEYVREQDLETRTGIFRNSLSASYLMNLEDQLKSDRGLKLFWDLPVATQENLREGYSGDAVGRQLIEKTYKPVTLPSPRQVLDYIDHHSERGSLEQARMLAARGVALGLCREGGLRTEVMERVRAQPVDRRGVLLASDSVAYALLDAETQPEILKWTQQQPLPIQADIIRSFCFIESIDKFHRSRSSEIEPGRPAVQIVSPAQKPPSFNLLMQQPVGVRCGILLTDRAIMEFSRADLKILYAEGTPEGDAAFQEHKRAEKEGRIARRSIDWVHPSLTDAAKDTPPVSPRNRAFAIQRS